MNRRSFITTAAALCAAPVLAKYVPRAWATGGREASSWVSSLYRVGEYGPECFMINPALISNEIVAGTLAVGTIRVDQLIAHTIIRTDHIDLT